MYTFLIIVHVIICFFLIAVILLQAGRGGGFSEMAGGNQMQSVLGSQSNVFMTRLTEVVAILFILTSLSLGILSTHKNKSLIEKNRSLLESKAAPSVPAESETEAPKAAVEATSPAAATPAPTK